MKKDDRLLKIGLLGCGPISQATHFDAIRKAKNASLYAICDVAEDLAKRMAEIHQPEKVYASLDEMLADPNLEAVVVAVADQFHIPLALKIAAAKKHIMIEKPLGLTVEECEEFYKALDGTGLVVQVGNNRRFSAGMMAAHRFVKEEMGALHTFEGWYFDSIYRYTMQDNLYPVPVESKNIRRPEGNPKLNRQRYTLITHSPHLIDRAHFLVGQITRVRARHRAIGTAQGWSIDLDFENGCLGHLLLISPRHGDFEEGFRIHGENGMAQGSFTLPWYQRGYVECFKNGEYRRLLGEDDFTFRRQIEGFADSILNHSPQHGANIVEGIETVRTLVAISISTETGGWVNIADVTGGVRAPDMDGEYGK